MRSRISTRWRLGAALVFLLAALATWRFGPWPSDLEFRAQAPASATAPLRLLSTQPASPHGRHTHAAPLRQTREDDLAIRHRLANTTRPLDDLMRSDDSLLLANALLDTRRPLDLPIPENLRAKGDPGSYVVQARSLVDAAFRQALTAAGATIVSYIPNNAFLVRATAAQAQSLRAHPRTQAVLAWEPYFKLAAPLLDIVVEDKLPGYERLNVLLFADARAATLQTLADMGSTVLLEEQSPFGAQVTITAPDAGLAALAALPGVQAIEPWRPRVPANDLSRVRLGVAPTANSDTNNYLGLTGKDILVAVVDSGIDATHPDLSGRVLGDTPRSLIDSNGHGTHVAGIIASSGANGPEATNASGSLVGAKFHGKAKEAKLFSMVNDFTRGRLLSDGYFQRTAFLTNAIISNNSWGYGNASEYNMAAANYDAAVRDTLPEVTGSQPLLFVFPAGNSGGGNVNGLGGQPGSIDSPGTAKNVITVGALEQLRSLTNLVKLPDATDTNGQPVWLAGTDSDSEVASYSSRGNVGMGTEGDFGRFKPDVVAPGSWVVSTRSSQWDTNAFYKTTTVQRSTTTNLLQPGQYFSDLFYISETAVSVRLQVLTDLSGAGPLPDITIWLKKDGYPDPGTGDFDAQAVNVLRSPGDTPLDPKGSYWYYTVGNLSAVTANFEFLIEVVTEGDAGDYWEVYAELNEKLGGQYRYETGTSMAAASVSGMLALMEQWFRERQVTNSPALMKALLINGARPASEIYDFQVAAEINQQGWGAARLPTSLPASLEGTLATRTNKGALLMFDQSVSNALATGASHTRMLKVDPADRLQPLRVTLVWTDPPGNPAASLKLVNDLDLIVTNLDGTNITYYGNDIAAGSDFNQPTGTNQPNPDMVNNVENVFLPSPLGTNYSITVRGSRVNVNAVHDHPNGVVQDYALVISLGDGYATNALEVTEPGQIVYTNGPLITYIDPASNGVPLIRQTAGEHSPFYSTNYFVDGYGYLAGVTNQWHFYVVTNNTTYTNAAFLTLLPATLSVPRQGVQVRNPANASREECDVDLYVSRDPDLLILSPAALRAADKSLTRGGRETVVYSNAAPGEVYYIGVKSEDRMGAEYAFISLFSLRPFGAQVPGGYIEVPFLPVPSLIPDGSPEKPGGVMLVGLNLFPQHIRRVIATLSLAHENFGDLLADLNHRGTFATLHNHSFGDESYSQTHIYEDNDEGDIPGSQPSDGPGNLMNFMGDDADPQWILTVVDNSLLRTGWVAGATLLIEPSVVEPGGVVVCRNPETWYRDSVEVRPGATNLTITIVTNAGPIAAYLRYGEPPTLDLYDKMGIIDPPGGSLALSVYDNPPLQPGVYHIGLYNPNPTVVCFRYLPPRVDYDLTVPPLIEVATTNPPVLLTDDAVTYATLDVTNTGRILGLEVGLRVDHPRVSDLDIFLISPNGTRILLIENRGALSTNGLGTEGVVVTNWSPLWRGEFDPAPVGLHAASAKFEDWTVLTNLVAVFNNPSDYCWTNNELALGHGVLSNSLPTTNPATYRLSFAVSHGPGFFGTVGWWPLDGDARDIAGGLDGLLCGNAFFHTGKVERLPLQRGAWYGDGFSTSVKVPRCPALDVGRLAVQNGRGGFTVEGWVFPDNVTNAAPLAEWNDGTNVVHMLWWNSTPKPVNPGVQLWLARGFTSAGGPGSLGAMIWDTNRTGTPLLIETPPGALTNGGWQHVALTYDQPTGRATLYTNGLPAVTVVKALRPASGGDLLFGHEPAVASPAVHFAGGLDELGVYERALTECEIRAIFSADRLGKYETNTLTCPVCVEVEIGTLRTNFVNGLAWATNALGWETNVLEFVQDSTNALPLLVRACDPNLKLDHFLLTAQTTNVYDGLVRFSEDERVAVVPVKFALPPFENTNTQPTVVFTNDFETAVARVYPNGETLGDPGLGPVWTLTNGAATVVSNSHLALTGTNCLALARGAVSCDLPTIPGHRYELTYSVRGPCAVSWWNGEQEPLSGRALDRLGGNHGEFIAGAAPSGGVVDRTGLSFITTNRAKIEIGDPAHLRLTNALTIEGWIAPDWGDLWPLGAVGQILFRGDLRGCLNPYYLALQRTGLDSGELLFHVEDETNRNCGFTLVTTNQPIVGGWQHVAATFETGPWVRESGTNGPFLPHTNNVLRLYVDGVLVAETNTASGPFAELDPAFSPGMALGSRSRADDSQPFKGWMDELTVYARALTPPEIMEIWRAGSQGKAAPGAPPPWSLAQLRVAIDGGEMERVLANNSAWNVRTFTFTARDTNTVLTLESLLPGTIVDEVTLTEVPGDLYFLPEESLDDLVGERAFGTWRLEIWDRRAGATNDDPSLVTWKLSFRFAPEYPPPVVTLTHCAPFDGSLAPNGIQHFIVPVPQWAFFATNFLTNATGPLAVLADPTNFPTVTSPILFPGWVTAGESVLATSNSLPFNITPSVAYFVAVTNPNPYGVSYSFSVCFDITSLTNCVAATNYVRPAGIPRYFQIDVPLPEERTPQEVTFLLTGANSNLTLVVSRSLPLPDLGDYDYISERPCTNDEVVVVLTNSTPWQLRRGRWYAGVFNTASTNVPFTIQACYSPPPALPPYLRFPQDVDTNSYPILITLTNAEPFHFVAPPGQPLWYYFVFPVTNHPSGLLFELYNLTGDADLVLQRHLPPVMDTYLAGSYRLGRTPEQIVVRRGLEIPDLHGTNWFLGVPNNDTNPVAFTIRAITNDVFGMLVSARPIRLAMAPPQPPAPPLAGHGPLIEWNAVEGEHYQVLVATNLVPPVVWRVMPSGSNLTFQATTPCMSFELPVFTNSASFFRVRQVPPP